MQHLPQKRDVPSLNVDARSTDEDVRLLDILPLIGDANSNETAVTLFREAVISLGADAGVFMSCLSDDATRTSLRSLWACDPVWAAQYASHMLFTHDPWLRYATHESEPICASEIRLRATEEAAFLAMAASYGFVSTVIAPAPSGAGTSRVGMLCLGSQHARHFENGAGAKVRVLARALAMELHRWLQQSMRKELLIRANLTDAELELLRHQAVGHSSKVIGAALHVEATTIDCRFQRLNAKLDAPDRRTALRIARLYGLL